MAQQIKSSVRINATAEKVWGVLNDFGGVKKFSIGVEKSPIIGDKHTGLGAKRHCVFYNQQSVIEEIVEYQEHESFTVFIVEPPAPLKTMHAEFRVEKLSDSSCEVFMKMDITLKFGPLGVLLGLVMMRPVLKGVQKKLLAGLAYHSCTGEVIGSELPPSEMLNQAIAS